MPKQTTADLVTPSALLDIERLERNIAKMAKRAKENGVNLRPHIKTHKCIEIGRLQAQAGTNGITVSTLGEAIAFADAGFRDMTYAVPLAPDKFEIVRRISETTQLKVLVDQPTIVSQLGLFCEKQKINLDVLIKVDCGYHRCGINPEDPAAINLVKKIRDTARLEFKGILTHAGHSYSATTVAGIKDIAMQEQDVMIQFANMLKAESADLAPEVVSIGSTPTVVLADSIREGITEIRPGNYAFFDYTQVALGTCAVTDCALTVLSSVISRNENRFIIDAGATALSKDQGPTHIISNPGYGKIVRNYEEGLLDTEVIVESLSQEHGKLTILGRTACKYKIGEKIRILPNHSCLTANLFEHYNVAKGDTIRGKWRVQRHRGEQ